MWKAFGDTFPALSEAHIAPATGRYLSYSTALLKDRFTFQPWRGAVAVRKIAPPRCTRCAPNCSPFREDGTVTAVAIQ
jgi:hypothetical protein